MSPRYKIGWERILLIAIVLIGLAARLYQINYNFDGDELFSVKLASSHFSKVISGSLLDTPHPPLHIVLLYLWIKVFGASAVSVRMLSVLFSMAFLVLSYVLLRKFVPRWIAFGLLSILALSPLFVYYGQQARPYALISFLAAANLLAFIRVLELPRDHKRLTIWAVSCTLLVYAQYMAVLFIGFQLLLALLLLRSGRLTIFAYGSLASVLILPWMMAAMGKAVLVGADPLAPIDWIRPPTFTELVWFYVSTFGDGPGLHARWLLLVLAVLGVAYIRDFDALKKLPASHVLFFLLCVGCPLMVYVVSVWGPKPVFAVRQLIGAAIALIAAVGLCMATLPKRLAAGLLAILLVWTAASLPEGFPVNVKPPWHHIAQAIDSQYGPVTVVAQEPLVGELVAFYRKQGNVKVLSEPALEADNDTVLFICRPVGSRCSNVDAKALTSRRALLETWRWGSHASEYNELRLYKVKGTPKSDTPAIDSLASKKVD